jgi:segregation and condensation protein A
MSIGTEQLTIDNQVINHLLFHKSLIDDSDDAARINEYVELLKHTDQGDLMGIDDPVDRSIALTFELVNQAHFNPWDIDLVQFSTLYLKRAKEENIDLITAGRIIHMAWKILRLQSDDLVINLQEPDPGEDNELSWDDFSTNMWLSTDDEYTYTNLLMTVPDPPIEEPVRRDSTRKVTLIELLDAFDYARKDSETHQIMEQRRREERKRLKDASRKRMKGTAHEDNLEEDIVEIWEKIKQIDQTNIAITDLCEDNTREELIKTIISVLFLAYDNKIKVYQKQFPYGKIFIKTLPYT